MVIRKCESDFLGISYNVGDMRLFPVSIYAEDNRAEVTVDVYHKDGKYLKQVSRRGTLQGTLLFTSVDNHPLVIYVNSGMIRPIIERYEKDFLQTAKALGSGSDSCTFLPKKMECYGAQCRIEILTYKIYLDESKMIYLEGPMQDNNLCYLEFEGIKFNVNVKTRALNITLE